MPGKYLRRQYATSLVENAPSKKALQVAVDVELQRISNARDFELISVSMTSTLYVSKECEERVWDALITYSFSAWEEGSN